ncbi:hypothetical protein BH23PLA1_BH23PLA1_11480 [soil metagenome]
MRIGIDLLAIQSPFSRGRGIGRYGRSLLEAMLALDSSNEYILYSYEDLPTDEVPTSERTRFRRIARVPTDEEHTLGHVAERIARSNPDGLDWLLLLSPFETWQFYGLPARPLNGLKMASVLYDMIPFLFPEVYLAAPNVGPWFYGHLQRLRAYDRLLTISEATRSDALRLLRLPQDRVLTIGTASDGRYFVPDRNGPVSKSSRLVLERLGIANRFVFCLGSGDARKNLTGLMDAFARLPDHLKREHRLVIACALTGEEADRVRQQAAERDVADRVILTGKVSDEELRVLYQRCSAFAFPSLYEGFGLPILEAMHCGAAVVAGDNSSQPEVVGDAGLTCNAADPADIAAKLTRVLADPSLATNLGARARLRADRFRWEDVARRTLEALTPPRPIRRRFDPGHSSRPRLAMFSPYPPKRSGISDYSARLLEPLKRTYSVDLYHDAGYVPDLGFSDRKCGCHDHRLFRRNSALLGYRGIIYHVGNSRYHEYIYDNLIQHPGVIVLHDFCLAGLHAGIAHSKGLEHLRAEVEHSHPGRSQELMESLPEWSSESGGLQEAMARRGLYVNRRVLEAAEAIIVHSAWCQNRVETLYPDLVEKVVVVPLGAEPRAINLLDRAEARRRFGIPADALVFANFGILHPIKLNVETIQAFAPVARENSRALLLFVGRDLGEGEAEREAQALGLLNQIRFLGHQPDAAYDDLVTVADIGLSLRRPPTNGETSASLLDLLRAGVPTITTDTGTFADLPDAIVRKIPWGQGQNDNAQLSAAMRELSVHREVREQLGQAAFQYVTKHHCWSYVVKKYSEVIEQAFAHRIGRSRLESTVPFPHVSPGWSQLTPLRSQGG